MSSRTQYDIASGYAAGYKQLQATGFSSAISDAAWTPLGDGFSSIGTEPGGADHLVLSETPGTLSVDPANPADTGRVAVAYLDQNYDEKLALFDLSGGASDVDLVTAGQVQALRVNQARYVAGGNAGRIDLKAGANLVNRIAAGDGLARTVLYTVPRGQIVMLTGFILTAEAAKPVEVQLRAKLPGAQPYVLDHFPARETFGASILPLPRRLQDFDFSVFPPVPILHGIDVYVEAKRPAGAATSAAVSVVLQLLCQQTEGSSGAPGFSDGV